LRWAALKKGERRDKELPLRSRFLGSRKYQKGKRITSVSSFVASGGRTIKSYYRRRPRKKKKGKGKANLGTKRGDGLILEKKGDTHRRSIAHMS